MNRKLTTIAAITFGLTSLSGCKLNDVSRFIPKDNADTVIDEPARPPCDPATGYYVADIGRGDAFTCVQPPMRTDCTDGQSLTKAGYFECNQPPETTTTTVPTTETTTPVK